MDRWRERRKSGFFAVLLAVLLVFLSTAPASAHTELINTTPAEGKRVSSAPGAVSLTFSGEVLKLGAAVKITGPDGRAEVGAAKIKARTVSWPLTGDLPNGRYTVSWRVTSADGHPIDGTFAFVLRAPVEPTAAPSTAAASPTSTAAPVVTPHTAEPQMTGPMEGMEGMPGMATSAPTPASGSPRATGVALAGLFLLTVLVAGAIVIERRRRPPPGAGPSAPASD